MKSRQALHDALKGTHSYWIFEIMKNMIITYKSAAEDGPHVCTSEPRSIHSKPSGPYNDKIRWPPCGATRL